MKVFDIKELAFPEIKAFKFTRFTDNRGFFTETSRRSDLESIGGGEIFKSVNFLQTNESYSKRGTVRGLHFQWNPYMGKLIRTIQGRMVDIILDIRVGSPNCSKAIMYDLPSSLELEFGEWLWIPPGFAHGNFFTDDSIIEYFCTSEYSPNFEGGISPLSNDIDWSLCDKNLKKTFGEIINGPLLISDKDRGAQGVREWLNGENAKYFVY